MRTAAARRRPRCSLVPPRTSCAALATRLVAADADVAADDDAPNASAGSDQTVNEGDTVEAGQARHVLVYRTVKMMGGNLLDNDKTGLFGAGPAVSAAQESALVGGDARVHSRVGVCEGRRRRRAVRGGCGGDGGRGRGHPALAPKGG